MTMDELGDWDILKIKAIKVVKKYIGGGMPTTQEIATYLLKKTPGGIGSLQVLEALVITLLSRVYDLENPNLKRRTQKKNNIKDMIT